jgi:hypothetical protein
MAKKKIFQFNLTNFRKQFADSRLPLDELICEIGKCFLDVPYQTATLESGHQEKLIVNFVQFDCFTFVETVLALAKCVESGNVTLKDFRKHLQLIRYRQGSVDGYASRLHYTLEWLDDNEKKKILHNITSGLPQATKFKKEINFMSNNRKLYPPLADLQTCETITLIEKNLSRKKHFYISKKDVSAALKQIGSGDIVAFTAQAKGLDIAHIGFAIRVNNGLKLLHASQKEGGVFVSAVSLKEYLVQNKKFTGIIVARIEV